MARILVENSGSPSAVARAASFTRLRASSCSNGMLVSITPLRYACRAAWPLSSTSRESSPQAVGSVEIAEQDGARLFARDAGAIEVDVLVAVVRAQADQVPLVGEHV